MKRKVLSICLAAIFGVAYAVVLFLPYPKGIGLRSETYLCTWQDGTQTEETFFTADKMLHSISEEGDIFLKDGERLGRVQTGGDMKSAISLLEGGELADLLSMAPQLSRLESAALLQTYGDRLYFDSESGEEEWFSFSGERVLRTERCTAREIVFMGGTLNADTVNAVQAETVILRERAQARPETFRGTHVRVIAFPPYTVRGGAVLKEEYGGILIAGVPDAREVVVERCVLAERGCLLSCPALESLTLPYVGSNAVKESESYSGELGYLFSADNFYQVPATLKRVKVNGGWLISFAFYACHALEEIDACGVDPEKIERQAFDGLENLKYLHTPRADVSLSGEFTRSLAPCGCTVYERTGGTP